MKRYITLNNYLHRAVSSTAVCCILAGIMTGCSFSEIFGSLGSGGMAVGKFYLKYNRMPSNTDDYLILAEMVYDSLEFGAAFGSALGADLDEAVEAHKLEGQQLAKSISMLNSRVAAYEKGNKALQNQIKECKSAAATMGKGAASAKLGKGVSQALSEAKSKRNMIDRDISTLNKNRSQYASQIAQLEKQRSALDANIRDLNSLSLTLR